MADMVLLLEKDKNGKSIAFKVVKGKKIQIAMSVYREERKRQKAAAKPAKRVAPKKKKAAKTVKAAEKPKPAKTNAARRVTKEEARARRVTKAGELARPVVRHQRAQMGAMSKQIGSMGKYGGRLGAGLGGGIATLILSSMLGGGGEKDKQPELPMGLLQMAGAQGGQNTSKTLMDITRLIAILTGAQGLAGAVAPPPMARVENQNPFSAQGLVA